MEFRPPAICRDCGEPFPSGFVFGNVRAHMTGNTSGPCPRCGGIGEVPDGIYHVVGDVVQIITSSGYSRAQLEAIAEVLQRGRDSHATPDQVAASLQEESPEFAEVLRGIVTHQAFWGFVTVLVMIVGLYLDHRGPQATSEAEIEMITRDAVQRSLEAERRTGPLPPRGAKRPPPPPKKAAKARAKRKRSR